MTGYVSVADLATAAQVERLAVMRMLIAMHETGIVPVVLLIWHPDCDDGAYAPVGHRKFGTGFPGLPYACPRCGATVEAQDDLRYDLGLVRKEGR